MFLVLSENSGAAQDNLRVVRAEEILARIERVEPVEYDNVRVMGDLDLSKMVSKTPGIVSSSIKFRNSEIYGIIDLNNTILDRPAVFERTIFHGPAYFFQTRFRGGVNFSHSQFDKAALFRGCLIERSAEFGEARFRDVSDFRKSYISADTANFRGSRFEGTANFIATRFYVEDANFEWAYFRGPARFWHSTFGDLANFRGSYFEDIADLYEAQFNDTADFFGAKFEKDLYFNDVKFRIFRVQWASIGDKLKCNGPPYLLLIKNFKDLEQFEDADSCYYQYRNWKRDGRSLGWPMVFDYLAWISCGYGVRWHHPIISGFIVILLFGFYFEFYDIICMILRPPSGGGLIHFSMIDFLRNLRIRLIFSATIMLSLPSEFYPFARDEFEQFVKSHLPTAILERLIGWSLMLLLIGTLSRLMVRY